MTKQKMILVGIHGRPSMKKVYDQMVSGMLIVRRRLLKRDKVYYRTYKENDSSSMIRVDAQPSLHDNIVIRWGTREVMDTNKGSVVYNKADAIANATDKKLSRELMHAAGVTVPRNVKSNLTNISYPVIARPSVHSKGRNFVVLKNKAELDHHYQGHEKRGWYYSEYVAKEAEYRFHVGHSKVLAIMEKTKPDNPKLLAWNRALNEEPFEYVNWEQLRENKGIADAAIESIKAVTALGLDFGGVDVMVKNGKAYVIEVNTAPTLNSSDYVSSKWAKYMDWLLRKETRREHFPPKKYDDARNYIFYNNQLAG